MKKSIDDLMYQMNEYAGMQISEGVWHVKTLKSALLKEFGDDVIITATKKQKSVVCFLGTGYKILSNMKKSPRTLKNRECALY